MESKVLLRFALVLVISIQMTVMHRPPGADAALSCGDAISGMAACGGYLVSVGERKPSDACCSAVRRLNAVTNTREARRSLCECMKQTGPSFGVKPVKARALPSWCKVKIDMAISPTMDCNKIP